MDGQACPSPRKLDPTTMFVDSHAHLDGKQFDSDREQVIVRAREAAAGTMGAIGNGGGPEHVDRGIRVAGEYDFLYAALSVHPHARPLTRDAPYQNMQRH